MNMKRIFIMLIIGVFFSGACAAKTKTGAVTDVGAGEGNVLESSGGPVSGGAKGPAIGIGAPRAAGIPVGMSIARFMDLQEEELQQALAGSEAASLKREQDILVITFSSDTMFAFDSAAIKPGARTEIKRVADVLYRYPQTRIRIEGYTDSTGSGEYNQKLSERRAEAVKNELIARNLQSDRIRTIGFGASKPVATNETPEGRRQNRRVQLVVMPENERL